MHCGHCGQPQYSDPEPHEVLVRDNASGAIYCAFCADELGRLSGPPPIIRHQDGTLFSFRVEV